MVVPTCRDSVPCQRHKALQKYIAKRLLLAIPAILGVSIVIFTMMRVIPGDPLGSYFNIEDIYRLSEEEKALIMHDLGLDRPYVLQYGDWLKDIFTGSLGDSLFRKDDILAGNRQAAAHKRRDRGAVDNPRVDHGPARGDSQRACDPSR